MKAEVYNALAVINQDSEDIVKQIEALRDEGVLTPHFADVRILAVQQNCSEVNVSAVHKLAQREAEDAGRLQNEREQRERELAQR